MLLVPNSAHALFARPLVLGPDSHVAVELRTGAEVSGIMWCDGRRHIDLPLVRGSRCAAEFVRCGWRA